MRRRPGAADPLEPILIDERGEGGLTEGDFPEDPEQGDPRLLTISREVRQDRGALRGGTVDRIRTGAEAEIDDMASCRRCQLKMRDLVGEDEGLGFRVEALAIPAEARAKRSRDDAHA